MLMCGLGNYCHPERSEGSRQHAEEILRYAQNDYGYQRIKALAILAAGRGLVKGWKFTDPEWQHSLDCRARTLYP